MASFLCIVDEVLLIEGVFKILLDVANIRDKDFSNVV